MTEQPHLSPSRQPVPHSDVLASDEDRERAVERVRAAVADGRLVLSGRDDRPDRVHGARTLGEPAEAACGLPEPGPRDSLGLALFGAVVTKPPDR
ncbi:uncharacterized protein DUF1707 [Streptomyces puniciscabiei]|uniref:Uncharacterized protein DUF1707 n=1 Tax=Streptomyces puniciscabiei TaxID=164348 RepID=A0A542UCU7_9ACTN|nr:DUF1707 domain-containing protein [Streptomyces puniciscabiei]TQK96868.1 uncharacterized protein DUF1707 [Streptomyces puniciscabiei]